MPGAYEFVGAINCWATAVARGDIGFAVPAVNRRIDQPHLLVHAPHEVSGPQVAVQKCRRFSGTRKFGKATDGLFDGGCLIAGEVTAILSRFEIGQHSAHGEELFPCVFRAVG